MVECYTRFMVIGQVHKQNQNKWLVPPFYVSNINPAGGRQIHAEGCVSFVWKPGMKMVKINASLRF